jgi:hypothetical protein
MEAASFPLALERMTVDDVAAVARDLDSMIGSVADEIATTRAVIQVEENLRRRRCRREAAVASQRAVRAVLAAAARDGFDTSDPDIVRVARAAGQYARALLVAGDVPRAVNRLATGFRHLDLQPI